MPHPHEPYQRFQQWYDEYFSFVYLFLVGYFAQRKIFVTDSEVEDMVQNCFMALLERKTNTPIEYPMAYLKKTAISQVRLFLEKKQRAGLKISVEPHHLHQLSDPNQHSALEWRESEQKVWALIQGILNQIESRLVFLRAVQGYSYKEIAAEEGMPNEQHLHTIYHRAKSKLYRHLKNLGYDSQQIR